MSGNTKGKFGGKTKASKRGGVKLGSGGKAKLAQLRQSRARLAAFKAGTAETPF